MFTRIHPFTLENVSSRGDVYSRHEPPNLSSPASSRVVKYCNLATIFAIPALEHSLNNWRWSGRFCEFSFIIVEQVSLHVVIGPGRFIRCRQFCLHHHSLRIVLSNKFTCTFWTSRDSPSHTSSHISATATLILSWLTEMIVRKNHFGCTVVTTEIYRQFSCSFASQTSSIESTGSTEYGMSTFTEVDHHVLSDAIPFSIACAHLLAYSATIREFATQVSRFSFSPIQCRYTLTWRWSVQGIAQVHTEFQSSCFGSRRESAM